MDLTTKKGISTLTHFGLLHFAGADAQAFLQGQLSCDVNGLQAAQAVYGSYNTPKGRMLATFLLWRDETGYVMQLPRSVCESTRRRLSMYVLRSKVTIHDASDEYHLFGMIGAETLAQLTPIFADVPAAALTMTAIPGACLLRLDNERCLIIVQRTGGEAIRIALAGSLARIDEATWDYSNICAGIPYIAPATQDQFVPQMANLDLINGVSFTKGCYPGQEIVARMHYLGKLKQRMYLATIAGPEIPQPGDKLYSPGTGDQATGMIVNTAPAPNGAQTVLAVMHIESFKAGEVHINSVTGPALTFLSLPYRIPS